MEKKVERFVVALNERGELIADYFHNKKVVSPEKITENYQLTMASPLLGAGFMGIGSLSDCFCEIEFSAFLLSRLSGLCVFAAQRRTRNPFCADYKR